MKLLRFGWFWLQAAGTLVAALAVAWLIAQSAFHLKLLNVQTGSMRPAFSPGDALVMRRAHTHDVQVGAIVSYHSPRNQSELITHRVVWAGQGSFQTKGDALSTPDPSVRNSLLAGRVAMVLPGLGRALNWLQTLPGLIVCIYLPAAAIAVQELARLNRHFQPRLYRLREVL